MQTDDDFVSDLNDGSADTGYTPAHGDAVQVSAPTPEPKPDTAAKPLSLRDQISSALKGEDATPPAAQQDGGQPRGPDGKFAPKAQDQSPDTPPAAPSVAAPQGIDPQVFASLPAETQALLARTMEDVSARQQRFATLEPLEQLITPRIDAWAMNGMSPAQAIHQLLALSDFAGRDPGRFIQYIAQQNGVDLEELVLGMDPPEPVDPRIQALEDRIAELQGHMTGHTQQQQQAMHEQTVNAVVAFAEEKGADGQPLRPYFAELGDAVLPYIDMVKRQNPNWPHAQVLQQAYDTACWAVPSVRSKLQAAASAAAEAEKLREGAKRAEAARAASASAPSGTPTSAPAAPNEPSRSLRETIRQSIAAHS